MELLNFHSTFTLTKVRAHLARCSF